MYVARNIIRGDPQMEKWHIHIYFTFISLDRFIFKKILYICIQMDKKI